MEESLKDLVLSFSNTWPYRMFRDSIESHFRSLKKWQTIRDEDFPEADENDSDWVEILLELSQHTKKDSGGHLEIALQVVQKLATLRRMVEELAPDLLEWVPDIGGTLPSEEEMDLWARHVRVLDGYFRNRGIFDRGQP